MSEPTQSQAVTLADVEAAASRIAAHIEHTPTTHSRTLSEITGAEVLVKFENLQFTASYKERGALNRLLLLPPSTKGVVAASAGNFAQGLAHHAHNLGIPAIIVMPVTTPLLKISRTEALGAEVLVRGETFEDAHAIAAAEAARRDFVLVSPFDDLEVIAGQGTVALELLGDAPGIDTVIVPVGGGGLLAGVAVAIKALAPGIELVGVQTESYPAVYNAFTGEHMVTGGSTIAEGIAVVSPGATSVPLILALVDRVELVPEPMIEQAIALYLEIEKTVAEGAGATPLAALLAHPGRYRGRRVALILSGGNIDLRQLASVTLRSLVRSGRLVTLWVPLADRPGSLGGVTVEVGRLGGNIVEVVHQRLDPTIHARATEVQLTVETSGPIHAEQIISGLRSAGYSVRTNHHDAG